MELIDFNNYSQNDRMYGGLSGNKIGIEYKNAPYILKFPKNLRNVNMKNIALSYSNSPVCEYLGSHIYEMMEIPVHETLLGTRQEKIVVACKDFLGRGDRLYEFREIKTTFEPQSTQEGTDATSGNGVELADVLKVIDEHPLLTQIPGVKERFWDMFIIDAYIGNSDRNNGNWGVISRLDGSKELAPVYDNGGCLNNKWDNAKMERFLDDYSLLRSQAYTGVVCTFTNNEKRINPFQYISTTTNKDCLNALERIFPKLKKNKFVVHDLIKNTSILSDMQIRFYTSMLDIRLNLALEPVFDKYFSSSRNNTR